MKRRDFLKLGVAGATTIVIGSKLPWMTGVANAATASQNLTITITDGIKDMHTKNALAAGIVDPNPIPAQCHFWIYKMVADGKALPPDSPGPTICAVKGDTINLTIKNDLDEPHSFFIPGIFDSGPIAPGATVTGTLTASVSGAHLYYDNLNEPVNRVMGLHGGLIVRPAAPVPGHNYTPYDNPTPRVQELYDSFGTSVFPGLKWEEGDAATNTPPFRQYLWILHQASPNLFKKVAELPAGQIFDAQLFQRQFLRDPFSPTRANDVPQYFTITGQSGFFSHFSPVITPMGRIGEPIVIHIINSGLWTHSMHYHFNHFYVTYDSSPANGGVLGGGVSSNPIWIDIYNIDPMDTVDYTLPFMRSPNIPTSRGLGLPDPPLQTDNGHPCYPPVEEMNVYMPKKGTFAMAANGSPVDLGQRESPLCYPMHDHSEPSQTSQGGNYNTGMISGVYCIGDRNTVNQLDANGNPLGDFMDFPMDEDFAMMFRNIRGVSSVTGRGTVPAPGTDPTLPPL
jgi:multicopper oxidase